MSKLEQLTENRTTSEPLYLDKAKYIYKEANEQCELIFEEIKKYQENKNSPEFSDTWNNEYLTNPDKFFNEENIERLATLPQSKRLCLLSKVASSIKMKPEMTRLLFEKFPEDLVAVAFLFDDEHGHASDNHNFYLYSLCATDLKGIDPSIQKRFPGFNQYEEIAKRRSGASNLVMDNFNPVGLEYFKEFDSNLQKDLFNILEEADEVARTGDQLIDPKKLFTDNYEKLLPEEKSSFLRKCLSTLHYSLLFEETFNSAFTEEHVKDSEQRRKERIKEDPWYAKMGYDVAHSMIFNSYQPFATYSFDQEYYNREMSSTAEIGGGIEEYPYHKMIIAVLEKLKNIPGQEEDNIETILDFWSKNKNPIFANVVSDCLSTQNPEYTARATMARIKNEKGDKQHLTALLYRLELGRMNISKEGAEYLERMYDLGEYNNENGHIERLTNEGEIGIFNEEQELIKYFHLGDLSTPEKKIRAKLFDISYETLFIEKPNESEEERSERLRYVEEFKKNYHAIAEEHIFKESGVRLNNLSFKEQGWFLIYFNNAPETQKDRLRNFVAQHGEEGIKTFLSLEENNEDGAENILQLAENLKPELAESIYNKFNEIVRLAKEADEVIRKELFSEEANNNINVNQIKRELLKNSVKIINNLSNDVANAQSDPNLVKNIWKKLENCKTEVITLASVLRAAKKEGASLSIEDIAALSLNINSYGEDLTDNDKKQILSLAKENWETLGNDKMTAAMLENLSEELKDTQNKKIYTLRYSGEIIGIIRFNPTDHNTLYFGSFNVNKDLRGLNIGNQMMELALLKESEKRDLEAAADIKIPVLSNYLEKTCMSITGVAENFHNSGETYCYIKTNRNRFQKSLNNEDESEESKQQLIKDAIDPEDLHEVIGSARIVLKCNLTKDFASYKNALLQLVPRIDDQYQPLEESDGRYTVTRYLRDRNQTDYVCYLVFERNDEKENIKNIKQKKAA